MHQTHCILSIAYKVAVILDCFDVLLEEALQFCRGLQNIVFLQ